MRKVPRSELLALPAFRRYFLGGTISSFGSSFGFLALTSWTRHS